MDIFGVYIIPTEAGFPPRAILIDHPDDGRKSVSGPLVVWSADDGCWTLNGFPVPGELSDLLTERARELGVESFLS